MFERMGEIMVPNLTALVIQVKAVLVLKGLISGLNPKFQTLDEEE